MNGFASKWRVRRRHSVTPDDLGADGTVRDDVVARWLEDACRAYLDDCMILASLRERSGSELRLRIAGPLTGEAIGRPTDVTVTATVPEIRPSSITIALRLRSFGSDDDRAFDTSCFVSLQHPGNGEVVELGDEVRDELIALEHGARFAN